MTLTNTQTDEVFLLLDTLQAYLKLSSVDGRPERQPLRNKLKIIMPVVRRHLADNEYTQAAIRNLENEGGITT